MELKNVVPWGRSFSEYCDMFCLTELDLQGSILGCGDGPASFNAELSACGGRVISMDPTYALTEAQFRTRIAEVYDEVMPQVLANRDAYLWHSIPSPEALGSIRLAAMERFLEDFPQGKAQGRYIEAALPDVPFAAEPFDLALCSHFLFLYSEQVSRQLHLQGIEALMRVAREVRIYPLVNLKGELSEHLPSVVAMARECGAEVALVDSQYRFQRGADQMLVIKRFQPE